MPPSSWRRRRGRARREGEEGKEEEGEEEEGRPDVQGLRAELAAHAAHRRSSSAVERYLRARGCARVRASLCRSVCPCGCERGSWCGEKGRRRWLRLRQVVSGPRRATGGGTWWKCRGGGKQSRVGEAEGRSVEIRRRGKARREDRNAGRERRGGEGRMRMPRGEEGRGDAGGSGLLPLPSPPPTRCPRQPRACGTLHAWGWRGWRCGGLPDRPGAGYRKPGLCAHPPRWGAALPPPRLRFRGAGGVFAAPAGGGRCAREPAGLGAAGRGFGEILRSP